MKLLLLRIPVTLPLHDGVPHCKALKVILVEHSITVIVVHVPDENIVRNEQILYFVSRIMTITFGLWLSLAIKGRVL